MNKLLMSLQLLGGTLGYVGTEAAQQAVNQATEIITQAPTALTNPDNYVKGLVVSGIVQIALKLIEKWFDKRKAKKEAEGAKTA